MRKRLGRLCALALGLMVLLTACAQQSGAGFDAGAYVAGLLNATYLGEFDPDYLEMVGLTEAEAQQEYANGIHTEVGNFYTAYNIETSTDELHEGIEKLYYEIYSHTSLTVTGVESQANGSFLVTVEVEPIDIVRQVHEDFGEVQEKFWSRYPEEIQNTMTTEEYAAFDAAWAQLVLGLYQDKLPTIGHLPARTVMLRVERDRQGYYSINSEDFLALDELVIAYSLTDETDQSQESPTPEESNQPQESGEPEESPAPEGGEAVQTGGQPPESQEPQESEKPSESPAPQESVNPNDPTPPTTGTPVPGLE